MRAALDVSRRLVRLARAAREILAETESPSEKHYSSALSDTTPTSASPSIGCSTTNLDEGDGSELAAKHWKGSNSANSECTVFASTRTEDFPRGTGSPYQTTDAVWPYQGTNPTTVLVPSASSNSLESFGGSAVLATPAITPAVPLESGSVSPSRTLSTPPSQSDDASGASIGTSSTPSSSAHTRAVIAAATVSSVFLLFVVLALAWFVYLKGGTFRGLLTRRISRRFVGGQLMGSESDVGSSARPAMLEAGVAPALASNASQSRTSAASQIETGTSYQPSSSGRIGQAFFNSTRLMRDLSVPISQTTLLSSLQSLPIPSRQFPSVSAGLGSAERLVPNAATSPSGSRAEKGSSEWRENWRKRKEAMTARWKDEEDFDRESSTSPKMPQKFQNLPSATSSMRTGEKPELSFNPDLPLPPIKWRHRMDEDADGEESCHSEEMLLV